MADLLTLEIVTPERQILEIKTPWVTIPGVVGELGILPEHVPVLTAIDTGVLRWWADNQERQAAVHYGYAQVENDRVTVLAEMAERREDINRQRAEEAERRARQELRRMIDEAADSKSRVKKYEAKLRRAAVRLNVAE